MQLYDATQTLQFWFSTILDTVLHFLAYFVVVLWFLLAPNTPLKSSHGIAMYNHYMKLVEEDCNAMVQRNQAGWSRESTTNRLSNHKQKYHCSHITDHQI